MKGAMLREAGRSGARMEDIEGLRRRGRRMLISAASKMKSPQVNEQATKLWA